MNEIINILMERDGDSREEARQRYEDTKAEIEDTFTGASVLTADEVLLEELDLEVDYIFNFI